MPNSTPNETSLPSTAVTLLPPREKQSTTEISVVAAQTGEPLAFNFDKYPQITSEAMKEHANDILAWTASGRTISSYCRTAREEGRKFVPVPSTVAEWGRRHPEYRELVERAREAGCDVLAEELIELGRARGDKIDVMNRRLEVETTLKLLSKWHRKRYGEHYEVEQTIEVKESPLAQLRKMQQARGQVVEAEVVSTPGPPAKPPTITTDEPVTLDDCL